MKSEWNLISTCVNLCEVMTVIVRRRWTWMVVRCSGGWGAMVSHKVELNN